MAKKCDVTLGSETQTGETRLPVPQNFIRTILVNIGKVSRDYMNTARSCYNRYHGNVLYSASSTPFDIACWCENHYNDRRKKMKNYGK